MPTLREAVENLANELELPLPITRNDVEKAEILVQDLQGGALLQGTEANHLYDEMLLALKLERMRLASLAVKPEASPSPFVAVSGRQVVELVPPSLLEEPPPFRSYPQFISETLNPQHYKKVILDDISAREGYRKWFIAQCYRRPNQYTGIIRLMLALIYTAGGIKGGGKSALIGNIAAWYRKIIAAYGSRDDEILAMLRMHDFRDKVPSRLAANLQNLERGLIIGPPTVSVTSSYNYIPYDKLTLNDLYNHDVIVAPQKICNTMADFFRGSEIVTNLLWNRPSAKGTWFLQILEAANVLYSRITLKRAKMDQAKAYLIFLMREMRHMGIAMGLDSQYMVSLDREVRVNSDYTFIKNMGSDKVPNDIRWIYRYVPPSGFMSLYPNEFVCKDKYGGVYLGMFKLPPWHKQPEENIYETMDIKFDVGDSKLQTSLNNIRADEDIIMHREMVGAYWNKENPKTFGSIKGTARVTGHDPETVRKAVSKHQEGKCSCPKPQDAA